MFCRFVMIMFYKRRKRALQNEKNRMDGEEMNVVEQAWMEKWDQVRGLYQAKLGSLGGCAQTQFADVLSTVQAESADPYASSYAYAAPADDTASAASPTAYDSLIKQASDKYSVPESLIKGVIKTESGFNAKAVSCCGAMGLMQLMPGTASGLGVTNAYDPAQNIDGGTRYLAGLLKRYGGDVRLALTAYNRGPGNVGSLSGGKSAQALWDGLSDKAQNYAQTVLGCARGYGYAAAI